MTRNTAKQDALLDELLKDYTDPKDILGEHGLLKQLTKRVIERVLEAELTTHLGYEPHARNGSGTANCRNGKGKKTVHTETAQFDIAVPRARDGSFEGYVANFAYEVVKGQESLSAGRLGGQGVEQFGRSETLVSGLDPQLFFL